MDVFHFNVNEDEMAYAKSSDFAEALDLLTEFPNDTIVTCCVGSAMYDRLNADVKRDTLTS